MRIQKKQKSPDIFSCIIVIVSIIIQSVIFHALAQAEPRLINFQAKLTDQQNQPLDGTYTVIFSIYETVIGGTALWTERHENLSIPDGLVNVLLGSVHSLDEPQKITFDGPRYLGITIDVDNNVNSPDPEMLPRQKIVPAIIAYDAYNSYNADNASNADNANNAYTLDGKDSTFFTNPTTDAGRPGVVEDLYEGNTSLESKYIKKLEKDTFQKRITGSCPSGNYIRAINEDGTVECSKDIDTDTQLSKQTVQAWADEVDTVNSCVIWCSVPANQCPSGYYPKGSWAVGGGDCSLAYCVNYHGTIGYCGWVTLCCTQK